MCFTRHRRILLAHWRSVHWKTVSRIFLGTVSLLLFVILRVNMSIQYCSCSEHPQPILAVPWRVLPHAMWVITETWLFSGNCGLLFSKWGSLLRHIFESLTHCGTLMDNIFEVFLCWVNLEHYKTRTLCLSRHTFLRLVIFSLDVEKEQRKYTTSNCTTCQLHSN